MLEITIWSLLVGNLGWQAVVASGWLRWQQIVTSRRHQEEEEILPSFEQTDQTAVTGSMQHNGNIDPNSRPSTGSMSLHSNGWNSRRDDLQSGGTPADQQLVGWEFKIVRASRDLFRDPAIFQKLCHEEAMAGWILLEKLDDRRVRFKRLIALRNVLDPQHLHFDPYRCHYGSSFTPLTWVGAIAAVMAMIVPSYLGYTLVSGMLSHTQNSPPSPYENIPPQDFPPTQ